MSVKAAAVRGAFLFAEDGADGKRRWPALVALIFGAIIALDLALPPDLARAETTSSVVTDRNGALLRAFPVDDGRWRLKGSLADTDPTLIDALIAYEDQRFFQHPGVDPPALVRAAASFVMTGEIVSGGSTLTMQVARLLEPRDRNIVSKAIEILRALQLERRFSKTEILELYLTLAPYGGNLEGVRAASIAYFGKDPGRLTPDQVALLVALPQSPESRRPDLRPERAIQARQRVLERLADEGVFPATFARESADYPAPVRRPFPALAWHASEDIRSQGSGSADIRSTIDLGLQQGMEDLVKRTALEAGGGTQVAAIVADVHGRHVRAAVGSADRKLPGGWIDLTTRQRSPGSTLKPFIYGIAFDDGVASAATRISDAPRRFSTYRPENFDRTFRGQVSIAEALQHSLNVPAVSALDAIGANRFAAALTFAGAEVSSPLSAGEDASLAIALGGVGMTVREVATLYAALADGGQVQPLQWTAQNRSAAPHARIMSAESASEILSILAGSPPPPGRMPARLTLGAPVVAYKTGTSYGFRDAWAAGIGAGYVVVIWIGRADGAPRAGATGRDAALPVLFESFDIIGRSLPDNAPTEIATIEQTADSILTAPPLRHFGSPDKAPPHILFPPDGAELWFDSEHASFILSAQSRRAIRWYVDGQAIALTKTGQAVWRPLHEGFYDIQAIDDAGTPSTSRVRLRSRQDP